MTEHEYAWWCAGNMAVHPRSRDVPCHDCPAWFMDEMALEGQCDRSRHMPRMGRPPLRGIDAEVRRVKNVWRVRAYRARKREAA